jgi:hypothetical protein
VHTRRTGRVRRNLGDKEQTIGHVGNVIRVPATTPYSKPAIRGKGNTSERPVRASDW